MAHDTGLSIKSVKIDVLTLASDGSILLGNHVMLDGPGDPINAQMRVAAVWPFVGPVSTLVSAEPLRDQRGAFLIIEYRDDGDIKTESLDDRDLRITSA